jgi:hypothetical protein
MLHQFFTILGAVTSVALISAGCYLLLAKTVFSAQRRRARRDGKILEALRYRNL